MHLDRQSVSLGIPIRRLHPADVAAEAAVAPEMCAETKCIAG